MFANTKLIIAAVVIAFSFGAGWQVNGWRLGNKITALQKDYAEAAAKASEENRRKEVAAQQRVDNIEATHAENIQQLETRIAAANRASRGLRDQLAAANRAAENPDATCKPDDAAKLRLLLGELSDLAFESAGAADAYAEQIRGLQEYVQSLR